MSSDVIPDTATTFGRRVRDRLAKEIVIWLTTVGADGTPQPNPVWFLWDGEESILVYNRTDAARLANVKARPRVSLSLNSTDHGGDVVVLTGDAEVLDGHPLATDNPQYTAKYQEEVARNFGDTAGFAEKYPVAMRIRVTKVRGL